MLERFHILAHKNATTGSQVDNVVIQLRDECVREKNPDSMAIRNSQNGNTRRIKGKPIKIAADVNWRN